MSKSEETKHPSLWQRKFLLIAGIIEIALAGFAAAFIVLLGFHGFTSGEMGNMVGIFAVAVLILLFPFAAGRIIAVGGLKRNKKWAAILTIALSAVILIGGLSTAQVSPVLFLFILFYGGFSVWAAIACLRHFDFSHNQQVNKKWSSNKSKS